MVFADSKYLIRFPSPLARRNSVNVIGLISIKLTFPTGKEEGLYGVVFGRAAVAMWY